MSESDETHQPVDQLIASTEAMQRALSGLDAAALSRRPAPDEWSAWDIAYHLAQIEVWYVAKLCEAASDGPAAALARFLVLWSSMRAQALSLAAAIPADRLNEAGRLTGVSDWTPRQLVQRMAAHDIEHTEQIRAAVNLDKGSDASDDGRGA